MVIPIEHIFGSEELSLQAPGVAELAFEPYLALNAGDAAASLKMRMLEKSRLNLGGAKQRLPLKVLPDLPAGVAGIPTGLPAAFGEVFPVWRGIERVNMISPHPFASIVGVLIVALSLSALAHMGGTQAACTLAGSLRP